MTIKQKLAQNTLDEVEVQVDGGVIYKGALDAVEDDFIVIDTDIENEDEPTGAMCHIMISKILSIRFM